MIRTFLSLLLVTGAGLAAAADVSTALVQAQEDVKGATRELTVHRKAIADQRRPLVEQIDQAVEQLAEQARAVDESDQKLQRVRQERKDREIRAAALETEWAQVQALLEEAARAAPTQLALAEGGVWTGLQVTNGVEVLSALREVEALRWGGYTFEGAVVDSAGKSSTRSVTQWGPSGWVAEGDGWLPLYTQLNQPVPTVDVTWDTRAGVFPLDPTVGEAAGKQQVLEKDWITRLVEGGPVMVPLIGVGLLALCLVVWKALSLSRIRRVSDSSVDAFVAAVAHGGGATEVAQASGPAQALFQHVIDHPKAPLEQLEELLHERILALLPSLDRHFGSLAVLAGIAPLLGLLGTVTGMIKTFQLITVFGSGDARMLSGGIAEALTTTAVGLIIAIPVLVAHAFLARRVRVLVADLENTVARVISRMEPEGRSDA